MNIGMRTCAIWLSATVLASSALVYGAEGEAELGGGYRAEVGLGRTAGEFSYEINFLAGGSKNRSKLTFPLDVPIVYGSVGWFLPRSDKGMLEVGLGVTTSFDDPRGAMTDEDLYAGYLVGYTESELVLEMWLLEAQAHFWQKSRAVRTGNYSWWWGGSYLYERYDAKVYGAEGYYFPPLGDGPVVLDSSVLALTYDLEMHALMMGVGGRGACSRFCVAGSVEAGPIYIQDLDVHELRGFYAEAQAGGAAIRLRGEGRVWLDSLRDPHWYLSVAISYFAAQALGEQTQYQQEQTYAGIEDSFAIERSSVTAGLGCEF